MCVCGPNSPVLALIVGLYAFMIVNSLCKIFVSIFVFKDYRTRDFLFFLKMFNYLGRFKHLKLFSLAFF